MVANAGRLLRWKRKSESQNSCCFWKMYFRIKSRNNIPITSQLHLQSLLLNFACFSAMLSISNLIWCFLNKKTRCPSAILIWFWGRYVNSNLEKNTKFMASWWLNQPIGKICASQFGSSSQGSGLKITNHWVATTQMAIEIWGLSMFYFWTPYHLLFTKKQDFLCPAKPLNQPNTRQKEFVVFFCMGKYTGMSCWYLVNGWTNSYISRLFTSPK